MCLNTDRVLEAKEHQLYLVDGGGVEVQIQFELGDGVRHDAPLRGMDEVSKDADDLLDVFDRQLELLTSLHIHIYKEIQSNLSSLKVWFELNKMRVWISQIKIYKS